MKIVLASRNRHKIAELETMLRGYLPEVELLSLDEVGITEEIEENGSTFEENALIKAKAAAKSGYIGVGDDSGLTVEALGGAPGIYSARYAAGMVTTRQTVNCCFTILQGLPIAARRLSAPSPAFFRTAGSRSW